MNEYIYCAINEKKEIQWIVGSSAKTRYFRTNNYLQKAVKFHNQHHPEDLWRIAKCKLIEEKMKKMKDAVKNKCIYFQLLT